MRVQHELIWFIGIGQPKSYYQVVLQTFARPTALPPSTTNYKPCLAKASLMKWNGPQRLLSGGLFRSCTTRTLAVHCRWVLKVFLIKYIYIHTCWLITLAIPGPLLCPFSEVSANLSDKINVLLASYVTLPLRFLNSRLRTASVWIELLLCGPFSLFSYSSLCF